MKPNLYLHPATSDIVTTARGFNYSIARDLFGASVATWKGLAVVDDDGAYGAPAWTEADGEIQIARATADALVPGRAEAWAVEALAHQLFHAVGVGPAFPFRIDALLEEAIAETLMQSYRPYFLAAFGMNTAPSPVTAFAVACDRLRTISGGDPVPLALGLKIMMPAKRNEALVAMAIPKAPFAGDRRVADAEGVTLASVPPFGAVSIALAKVEDDPAISHAVHRSLDYGLHIGWARDIHSAAKLG